MIRTDGSHSIILFSGSGSSVYAQEIMSTERDRVISISLTESEWQAFVARQPQSVQWLRDRIRDELEQTSRDAQPQRQPA